MKSSALPELLLPVGNMDMLLAAIHNGADAVYIGMPKFNARGRTTDFSVTELQEMVELAHLYGVKVHLAFNILIFEEELTLAEAALNEVLPLGIDAFIVQDIGLARLIRSMSSTQVIHGSTQMTVTNHEAMKLINDLSLERFVLGREVSLPEIKIIREQTDKELEVFVHGALCVSYSGQCLTSESIGGRSANRGQCAQSCRLDYELYVDGEKKNLVDEKYLVSPQDLCGIEEIPELIKLGVNSFKVEGRLKSKEYVAAAASSYQKAIRGEYEKTFKSEMAITYSRGFFSGWLHGVDHQKLVEGTYSSHQGLNLGKVIKTDAKKKTFTIKTDYELSLGDGLLFTHTRKQESLGGTIYAITKQAQGYEISMGQEFSFQSLSIEWNCFLNSSPKLFKKLNAQVLDKNKNKKILCTFKVEGKENSPLTVTMSDGTHSVTQTSESLLTLAQNKAVTHAFLQEELQSLGGTCFIADAFSFKLEEKFFINHKELKNLRRQLVASLVEARITPKPMVILPALSLEVKTTSTKSAIELNVLIRSKKQIEALRGSEVHTVTLDFDYGKDYKEAIIELKAMGFNTCIATTRILKPTEYKNLNVILGANPDMILVRNLGALQYFKDKQVTQEVIGDYSLNVTNSFTSDYLLSKGLGRFTPSYDLNQWQLFDLLRNSDASKAEITIHQYLPEFHMEHCVFAGFMSTGSSFRDCGMPCEKHDVVLKDAYGNFHPLKADQECRNTMFRGTPQSAGQLVPDLLKLGATHFRLEALSETALELRSKIDHYLDLIQGKITPEELFHKVQVAEKYGLSQGQLDKNQTYKDRKKN